MYASSGPKQWLPPCQDFADLTRSPTLGDFDKVSNLGKGAYGLVFRVKYKGNGIQYAMKVISKQTISNLRMIDQLKNEFNILRKLKHENIIRLDGYFEDDRNIYFILELADDDHLYAKLNKVEKFSEADAAALMFQMFKACHYLHTQSPPIIHRDIKPENILFVKGVLKLADFGWSNMKVNAARNTYCGTPDYLAPEMVLEKSHTEKLDVWTCGVLLFELVSGRAPFTPSSTIKDRKVAQRELMKNIVELKMKIPSNLTSPCIALIKKLLQKDYRNRPSCAEALLDPFFANNGLVWVPPAAPILEKQPSEGPNPIKTSGLQSPMKLSKHDSGSIVDDSTVASSVSVVAIDVYLKMLPNNLLTLYKTDKSGFLKELLKAYVNLADSEKNLRDIVEAKDEVAKALDKDKSKLTEQNKKQESEIAGLNKKVSDLLKSASDLKAELDEASRQKGKCLAQIEDLKKNHLMSEKDWQKEKDELAKNSKQMEEILGDNPQTRPAVIQTSLSKVIKMLEDVNGHYLKQEGTDTVLSTEDMLNIIAEKEELHRSLQTLKKDLEGQLNHAKEIADSENQARFHTQVAEYKAKRDAQVQELESKLADLAKSSGNEAMLKDKVASLEAKLDDNKGMIDAVTQNESALKIQVESKERSINDLKNTIQEFTMMIEAMNQMRR